jgi:hypothetical protein
VLPHAEGTLRIPVRGVRRGDILSLKFYDPDGLLIDEHSLPIDPAPFMIAAPQGPAPTIRDSADSISVSGGSFVVVFSKATGLVTSGTYRGQTLIKGGPSLNVIGADLQPWSVRSISAHAAVSEAVVNIAGSYGPVEASFEIRIDGQGLITAKYTLDRFDVNVPETKVVPWNSTNAGGFEEVGISWLLDGGVDSLAWKRNGLWSDYPDDHIGRTMGIARRSGPGAQARPGVRPAWPWAEDEKDFNLYGPDDKGGRGTNDFRSMKEYVYYASAIVGGAYRVRAESNASDAVRLEVSGADVRMYIDNLWNYRQIGLGNFMKEPVVVKTGYSNVVRVRLTDRDNGTLN